jgi:tetratricopeptide (TPR) repeat protein
VLEHSRIGIFLFEASLKSFKTQDDMSDHDVKEKTEFLSMARGYLDQSLYKEAHDLAELWLHRHPVDADANIVFCHALLKMGKLERVEEVLEGVEDSILQLSRIYAVMGDICLEGGLTREAIRFYQKFISINPESIVAEKISAKLQGLLDERSEEAEAEHADSISHVASDFYTLTLAELYIRQGHLQMAVEVLTEILKKDADNQSAAERFNEVKKMLNDKSQREVVVKELTKWLRNIDRISHYVS